MKILVISDSHWNGNALDKILFRENTIREVFFLGDVTDDIEDFRFMYPERNFHIVSGNCDFMSNYPFVGMERVEDVSVLFTHGHNYNVKYGTDALYAAAVQRNCRLVLYGHTHVAKIDIRSDVFLVNPGSCSRSRSGGDTYAVIDINGEDIYPEIRNV